MAKARTCTELLIGGINSNAAAANHSQTGSAHQNPGGDQSNLFLKPARQWMASTLMDYFDSPLLRPSSSSRTHHSSGFLGQIHLENSRPHAMSVFNNVFGDNHPELQQHFPFNVPEHLIPVGAATSQQPGRSDYSLNFTKSSGLAGYNRGTLKSNSPSLLPYHL